MEKQRLEKEKKEEDIYFKNLMSEINKKRKEDSLIYLRDSLEAKTTQEKLLKTTKLKEKMAMQIRKHEDSIKVLKDSIRTAKLKMRIEEEKKYLTNKGFKIEQDSALLKAFQRNKHWKNQLLVVDVTGSMYVYLNQFKIWYSSKHNIFPNKMQFVLFNDGDDALKNNVYKKVGTTGGIYFSTTADFVDLETQMTKARQNGGGGDTPENDLEAVIKAIEKCKNYNEVILIADNTSQVRDIELLPKIKKPLRIILCGADFYVNGQYLEIAYKTKGSIHLLREDVDFSSKNLANYEKITIQNRTYMFVNERFFLLSDE
ncbi:MAG: hypothetical protein EAZ20_10485 [Bacteroidetes bacterium]|nr:MAG: hypothetical protein EAZ20_10485 [Bacteroidota bacterium]